MSQTDLSTRLARWALKLQGYKFNIQHRRGSLNVVPDTLSRANTDDMSALGLYSLSDFENDSGLFVDLTSTHFQSHEYRQLLDRIGGNLDKLPDLKIIDGYLYRRTEHATGEQLQDDLSWKLWIPREMIPEILKKAHDNPLSSHGGINKTLARIRKFYYWPNLVVDVKNYVNNCDVCKSTKHPNTVMRPPMGKSPETCRFFQKLYVDFLGPYPRSRSGHIGIFIVLDNFSKFPFLKPVKKFTSDIIVKYLEGDLFHTFGVPETIVSDNGSQFKSVQFNQFLKRYGVHHTYTAIHSPQANASERVNRSVLAGIKSYIKRDQKNWDELLSSICCSLRSSVHTGIGTSPYYLVFGQDMVTNGATYSLLRQLEMMEDRAVRFNRSDTRDILAKRASENTEKQFNRNKRSYDLRSKEVSYNVGQEIYRRNFKQSNFEQNYNAKLAPTFLKARVQKKLGNSYYILEDLKGNFIGTYHAKDIRQ